MKMSVSAAAVMAAACAAAVIGPAGPADAADEWIMPDVKTETLQNAINDVQSVVGDAELNFKFVPRSVNQVVYNYSNWAVCSTYPNPSSKISQKSKQVVFSLRRLNEKC